MSKAAVAPCSTPFRRSEETAIFWRLRILQRRVVFLGSWWCRAAGTIEIDLVFRGHWDLLLLGSAFLLFRLLSSVSLVSSLLGVSLLGGWSRGRFFCPSLFLRIVKIVEAGEC